MNTFIIRAGLVPDMLPEVIDRSQGVYPLKCPRWRSDGGIQLDPHFPPSNVFKVCLPPANKMAAK